MPIRNLVIVGVMWLIFAGGLWAYRSRKRDGLRVDITDAWVCVAAIIVLGYILLDMLFTGLTLGFE
jgi:hypothetical protein